ISERIIGLTVVSVGTSLPELITSVEAGRKGESGIAIGNIVGSNIFNVMFVLGMAGTVSPLTVNAGMILDMAVLICVSLVTLLFVYTGRKVVRLEGGTMVAMYAAYMVFVCVKAL
ncbi:MAG: sodium:calcium antiporter, partial [Oscillospiraceae bacterium]|nr:sodium:calcium antiporter [Oscillospiraceae bacterium]